MEMQRSASGRISDGQAELAEWGAGSGCVDDTLQRAGGRIVKDRLSDRAVLVPGLVALTADGQ